MTTLVVEKLNRWKEELRIRADQHPKNPERTGHFANNLNTGPTSECAAVRHMGAM